MTLLARLARLPFAVAMAMLFAFGALTPAFAQRSAESAAVRYGVQVERVVSPGGVEAWLVSDSTVPMIVVRAYWRGGAAVGVEDQPMMAIDRRRQAEDDARADLRRGD